MQSYYFTMIYNYYYLVIITNSRGASSRTCPFKQPQDEKTDGLVRIYITQHRGEIIEKSDQESGALWVPPPYPADISPAQLFHKNLFYLIKHGGQSRIETATSGLLISADQLRLDNIRNIGNQSIKPAMTCYRRKYRDVKIYWICYLYVTY